MRICSMAKSANEVLVQILGEKIQSARILQMETTPAIILYKYIKRRERDISAYMQR